MTPFQNDIINFTANFIDILNKVICYFIGHNWSEWQDSYDDFALGRNRRCKRCDEFEYDSQALKVGR